MSVAAEPNDRTSGPSSGASSGASSGPSSGPSSGSSSPSTPPSGAPDEPHRLACGLCKTLLDGQHPTRAAADRAADEHVPEVHPDRESVVVLSVPARLEDELADDALRMATAAQARVDRRRDGSG